MLKTIINLFGIVFCIKSRNVMKKSVKDAKLCGTLVMQSTVRILHRKKGKKIVLV